MDHYPAHTSAGTRSVHASRSDGWLPDSAQVSAVYRFMYRHVGNREDAEQLTERACVRAVRSASGAPECHDSETALFQIACEVVTEHLRWFLSASWSRASDATDDISALPAAAAVRYSDQAGAMTHARRLLARLPAVEGELLATRLLHCAPLAEAAARLHLTPEDALALQWSALAHAAHMTAREPRRRRHRRAAFRSEWRHLLESSLTHG